MGVIEISLGNNDVQAQELAYMPPAWVWKNWKPLLRNVLKSRTDRA